MKLQEKEPFIANGVIQILREWKSRNGPRLLIITEEDIEQLAEWADNLHRAWEWTHQFHIDHDMSTKIIPHQFTGDNDELQTRNNSRTVARIPNFLGYYGIDRTSLIGSIMSHYLFIGGPWDGCWEEAPGSDIIHLAERPPLRIVKPLIADEKFKKDLKIHTYTLRGIGTALASVRVYVEDSISDRHLLTKLLSVYTRT